MPYSYIVRLNAEFPAVFLCDCEVETKQQKQSEDLQFQDFDKVFYFVPLDIRRLDSIDLFISNYPVNQQFSIDLNREKKKFVIDYTKEFAEEALAYALRDEIPT